MSAAKNLKSNLSNEEIIRFISSEVTKIAGIQLGEKQKTMVESRLKNRMLDLKIKEFQDYYIFFSSHENNEVQKLVSLLTTHHTYFFREFSHFEYIEFKLMPQLIDLARKRNDKTIKIWSAACSRGQEVYSLAMFLDEVLKRVAPDIKFKIYGSDIDPESVKIAQNGVYPYENIKSIPLKYAGQNWVRGTGEISDFAKFKKPLRDQVAFGVTNLFDIKNLPYEKFDVIFCRNVFIYFTTDQIKEITNNILKKMEPSGYFFIGISESLHGLNLAVDNKGPSIYSHKGAPANNVKSAMVPSSMSDKKTNSAVSSPTLNKNIPPLITTESPSALSFSMPEKLKVLCVDDSSTILSLLKKLLTAEFGFEVVATASNGLEAAEALKKHQVDLVTLDIHMPEQTGIEYLQKNYNSSHPPVVMVTSVSRENSELALQALELGASDFIEKPSLQVITERADEIRMKLKCAFTNKQLNFSKKDLNLTKSFQKMSIIRNPEKKARIIFMSLSDRERVLSTLKEFESKGQPPTYLVVEGSEGALEEFAKKLSFQSGKNISYIDKFEAQQNKSDQYFICDYKKIFGELKQKLPAPQTSIMVYGDPSKDAVQKILLWKDGQILVEDRGQGTKSPFSLRATDIVPATSFAYMSTEFLGKTL